MSYARPRSPRATLNDVIWTENGTTWHAVSERNRWGRALCGTLTDGIYAFEVRTHPVGPPRSVQGSRRVCEPCLERLDRMTEQEIVP